MNAVALPTAPATTARGSLADQIYATLKAELHDFRWVPGDRLSEGELGPRLGVSRTPVREARFRLRNEGLLAEEAKSGWKVRPIDFTRRDRIEATYAEHAKILRAVIQRKADPARLMLKSHIEQSKVEVRKITLHTLLEARRRADGS